MKKSILYKHKRIILCLSIMIILFAFQMPLEAQFQPLIKTNYEAKSKFTGKTDFDGYEIFTLGTADRPKGETSRLLPETPRQALNEDGLVGLFVSETADRVRPKRMFSGVRFNYVDITSKRGRAFYSGEEGTINNLLLSLNFIGEWAEWAVTVPVHSFSLAAPRQYGRTADDNEGLGNMKLAWKATYLPDKSYYRFAYGAVIEATTGDPDTMWPTSKRDDELKLFGCVTTKETDYAVGNLELGAVLDSKGENERFIYRLGLAYQATEHGTLIGELAGEVQGGDDKDSMDIIAGIRLAPSANSVIEFQYTKNLRTYREFGWDQRLGAGLTVRW
ncbi:MAG: hypothetical protein HQM10_07635 [Candidatus Riflebacteria bacterium]|nr:hypothetical protein [Candidatus Riflebacteria bacterium]